MMFADRLPNLLVGALLLSVLSFVATFPGAASLFERLNLVVYDLLLPVQSPEMSDDIVVVAIDNRSLEELGRWPWDRSYHAQLIDKLVSLDAGVIAVDILFSEYQLDDPESDAQLVAAVDDATVVLPIAPSQQAGTRLMTELMPIPELAAATSAMGHVDVELDSDGLCRRTFLYGGLGDARWPSFALAMWQMGDPQAAAVMTAESSEDVGAAWLRASQRLIPFTNPEDGPLVVSFSDILDGRYGKEDIAGKYILIGATGTGLGDAISTPGAFSHERMPGVVLNAQILNGLLQDRMIQPMGIAASTQLTFALVAVILVAIFASPTRFSLYVALGGVALVLCTSAALLAFGLRWYAPAAAMTAVLLAWPAWTAAQYQRARGLRDRLLKQLESQARYHFATGLPNNGMLMERLRALNEDGGEQGVCALMVMHVNWPGSASVVLDRPLSDPVLQTIRDRIRETVHPTDFVAHLSGDDFAVLSTGIANRDDARQNAIAFLDHMQKPFNYQDEHLLLAPQIGVSLWPADTENPDELLRNAYTAMFKSRIDESESLCLYSATVSSELQARSQLEQALVHALERREFSMHYQPQVSSRDGRIIGVEALLRWENPLLGWVSPAAFVPVAEHVGLIKSIGAWVIEHACEQLQQWNAAGFDDIRMAINVSPLQFLVPGLEDEIQKIIQRVDVDPANVELEITESSLMQDIGNAIRIMNRIKEFGLELAIDDFGTGYSSLSNLRHFPLDRLKIDQAFVQEIGISPHAEKITLTIITMARHLGLNLIAEGVETQAQADFLLAQGVEEFQGYLYGTPDARLRNSSRVRKRAERLIAPLQAPSGLQFRQTDPIPDTAQRAFNGESGSNEFSVLPSPGHELQANGHTLGVPAYGQRHGAELQ